MGRTSLILAAGLMTVLITSASIPSTDQVQGTGDVVKKTLNVDAFHGIELQGSMDVIITKAAERSVVVEAQANIAELVTTNVKNGSWLISTSKNYSTNKPFIVHISVPEIDGINSEGSGDVKCIGTFDATEASVAIAGSGNVLMNYKAGSINASIEGSGDLHLGGTCDRLKVSIAGSGDVNAADLVSRDLVVEIGGSGDVNADANGDVRVSIAGSGDVLLARAPTHIDKLINGSGTLRIAH